MPVVAVYRVLRTIADNFLFRPVEECERANISMSR